MIVDTSKAEIPFADMAEGLDRIGAELGVSINCQKEEIFTQMHRI